MKILLSQLRRIISEETKKVVSLRVVPGEAEAGSCPLPTQDLELNTRNRNSAIRAEHIEYGPLNLNDEEYWEHLADHWNTTPEVAKQSKCGNCAAFDISPRMEECMPGMVQNDGILGYCWMHKFKCHSARSCYTWAAGGPIETDDVSYDWQSRQDD